MHVLQPKLETISAQHRAPRVSPAPAALLRGSPRLSALAEVRGQPPTCPSTYAQHCWGGQRSRSLGTASAAAAGPYGVPMPPSPAQPSSPVPRPCPALPWAFVAFQAEMQTPFCTCPRTPLPRVASRHRGHKGGGRAPCLGQAQLQAPPLSPWPPGQGRAGTPPPAAGLAAAPQPRRCLERASALQPQLSASGASHAEQRAPAPRADGSWVL